MGSIKDLHKKIIVEQSIDLFVNKGINKVTMSDIASEVEIGEATLYRYFGRKQNIVMLSAISLWEKICNQYLVYKEGMSGLDSLKDFYNAFLNTFIEHPKYFSFVYELDSLILNESIDYDLLEQYDKLFIRLQELWNGYYIRGVKDFSIRHLEDPVKFYITSTHAILNMCKRLAATTTSLSSDKTISPVDEIQTLIDMLIYYIKKN